MLPQKTFIHYTAKTMRLFYFYPTFDKPSGGNKQLRLQATLLRELGVEALLLRDAAYFSRQPPFDDDHYYGVPLPLAPFPFEQAGPHLGPDDVVLLPEGVLERSLAVVEGWKARLAVNNQNGFYGLRYGPPASALRGRLEFAFANAPYVAALCQQFYGLPGERVFLVPHWIVRPPFDLRDEPPPTSLSVAYMPRKLPDLVAAIRVRAEEARPDVPWVPIDGVPEPEVSARMRSCKVFFAAQDLEGCPLTALEAMTCGAVVAGFPGTAGFPHPYATPENGYWAPDRDLDAAVARVVEAIDLARAGGPAYAARLDAGRRTADRFSKDAVLTSLKEVVRVLPTGDFASRPAAHWSLGWRGSLQAYKLLYDYDRLGWAGRALSRVLRMTKSIRAAFSRRRG